MSIGDGFSLWLGKTLAEFFIVAAFLGLLFIGWMVAVVIEMLRHKRRQRP